MFAILLLNIIGLFARYSKTSPIYEDVSPGAGTAGYYFSPTPGMPDARIYDVPSVADKPIEDNIQSIGAMNIIAAPREKLKKSMPRRCQVRIKTPSTAANATLTQASSCTFS